MKKRYITFILAFVTVTALVLSACGGNGGGSTTDNSGSTPPAATDNGATASGGELVVTGSQSDMQKDSIVVRGVRSQTGTNAIFEQTAFGPQYKMMFDLLNQQGGLYVKSLDRKVPIDYKVYDDGSDITKTTQLFEQMCLDDKPDLILPPVSTAALFACTPIAQKYDYFMVAGEGGAKELEKYLPPLGPNKNVFSVLNYSETQVPALIKIFQELGVQSVFCAYIDDLHGTEYWGATKPALEAVGIEVKGEQMVPLTASDGDPVVNAAKQSGADAFLVYTYPDQGLPIAKSAIALNYNPKLYLMGPGGTYDFVRGMLWGGTSVDPDVGMNGVIGWGGWNEKSSDAAKAYSEQFRQYWTDKGEFWLNADGTPNPNGTVYQDWWGQICYWSACQIIEQAVENAGQLNSDGTLDQDLLVQYTTENSFNTALNANLHFTNNVLTDDMYLGNVSQWQNGSCEVIDNDARRTTDTVIYPKPPWPTN